MTETDRRGVLRGTAGLVTGLLLASARPVWAAADAPDVAAKLLAAVPPHGERSLGAADAPVVIIEYASATCPHCAEFHADVLPEIKKTYIDTGKARLIFREFPLDQRAMAVFMLTRCVPEDKYFATVDMVFRQQKSWTSNSPKAPLLKIMQMAGMSEAEWRISQRRSSKPARRRTSSSA